MIFKKVTLEQCFFLIGPITYDKQGPVKGFFKLEFDPLLSARIIHGLVTSIIEIFIRETKTGLFTKKTLELF